MKRAVSLLLSAALLLGPLNACRDSGRPAAPMRDWTVDELAELALARSGREGQEDLEFLSGDREMLAAYIESAYGLEGLWEEAAVVLAAGASAFEIAVLRMEDDEAAAEAVSALREYIFVREGDFTGYMPDEAAMAANGSVMRDGPFAALFICPDPDGAYDAVGAVLNGGTIPESGSNGVTDPDARNTVSNYPDRYPFTAPNKDDMSLYDTSAILTAWEKGDPAELSGYDRDIYDEAEQVLDEVLEPGMSDYEKELAIYSWLVNNVNYDWTHQDRRNITPRESFTPYGGLVNRAAVCLGYAATFQLLMDMAGLECVTVTGAAYKSREDHGWNMARLNGEWYCVDATWDANKRERTGRGGQGDWRYFNVTSDFMAREHQWDYANTPEATAEDHGKG